MRSLKCLWSFLMEVVKQCLFVCTERQIEIFQCLKGRGCGHGEDSKVEVIRTWHLVHRRVGGATEASSGHLGRACLCAWGCGQCLVCLFPAWTIRGDTFYILAFFFAKISLIFLIMLE